MIRKVSFRNFKAYRSLDVELEPFTVLVGPNASGKTTLLQGVGIASVVAQHMIRGGRAYFPFPPWLQSYGVKAPVEVGLKGTWNGVEGEVAAISGSEPERPQEGEPFLAFKLVGKWRGKGFSAGSGQGKMVQDRPSVFGDLDTSALDELRAELSSTAVLQFEPDRLAESSYSEEAIPHIEPDGSGLASVLAYLKLSQDEVFEQIEQALREVVPTVRRVRIERAEVEHAVLVPSESVVLRRPREEVRKLWGHRLVLDMRGAKGVAADAAGEGTLMALGLLTVIMVSPHPRLVLLDDIELRLHPAAQAKLIEVLRSIQKKDPGLQIVATSHSPFILNYLDPKEVRTTFLAENGFARCEKLTAHPEFEKWKGLMTPGEFWSTVGESWLEKVGDTSAHE